MQRYVKIFVVIVLLIAAGFFLIQQFNESDPSDAEIEAIKENILADPVIKVDDLSEEQQKKFLDQFEIAKNDLLKFDFENLQALNMAGFIKQSLGDFEGAIVAYEYGNLIRPKNSLTFSNLATLYHFDLNDFEKAEKNYLISIANDADDIPTIRNLYELYFYALEDPKKTEALLLKSINDNPEASDLYSLAGTFYRDIGEKNKAIEMFEKHLELNPGSVSVREALEKLRKESN